MQQQTFFFTMAVLLIALGTPRLIFPAWVHDRIEALRYAYPLEPSRFRLIAIRVSGLIFSVTGLGFAWFGITH